MTTFFNCPDGLAFDSEINACNFPEVVKCINPNIVKEKSTRPEEVKTHQTEQNKNNNNMCPKGILMNKFSA